MVILQHPEALWLLLAIVPLAWSAWRLVPRIGGTRAWLSCAARALLLALLVVALARPLLPRGSDDVTVAVVVDRSRSVSASALQQAVEWVNAAAAAAPRTETDRLAVVHVAAEAVPGAMPAPTSEVSLLVSPGRRDATRLNSGIELAKAMLPQDTRNRVLLVSDGLDTAGSLAAASASNVPVDVLVVPVDRGRDVRIERLVAPSRARAGLPVEVEVVLQTLVPATGRLVVKHNGVPVQLDGGSDLHLTLASGSTVVPLRVAAGTDLTRVEATWLPDDRTGDAPENDVGRTVILPASVGRVVLVSEDPQETRWLHQVLLDDGIDVQVTDSAAISEGTGSLAAADAIVLVNTPRWAFTPQFETALRIWVERTGGGLLMTGGSQAFGAGGWIGSSLEDTLPVLLDPPAQRQVQRGALVLIMHSCEMERGNYWGRRICETAIESLSSRDLVGIVEYASRRGDASWAFPLQEAGDRVAALQAARQLSYGDMPDFGPSMQASLDALRDVEAGQKHIVLISDGDPQPPSVETLQGMQAAGITVTTVQVGGHGRAQDRTRMERIATATGGEFHRVENPAQLPQIIVEASQLASRTLLMDEIAPVAHTGASAGPVQSLSIPPPVNGWVLTVPRAAQASTPWVVQSTEGVDPLVAWWHRGAGRVAVVTVPPDDVFTPQWNAWPSRDRFWIDLVRWLRPAPDDGDWALLTREGDQGHVEVSLEALTEAAQSRLPVARGVLMAPDGTSRPLDLQPAGPGRAVGSWVMDAPGEWVAVALVDEPGAEAPIALRVATAQAWPDEDRARHANVAALTHLAEATGGRVHTLAAEPHDAALFSREGLDRLTAPATIWPWLVIAAAVLLPIDVAVRRLVLRRSDAPGVAVGRGVQRTPVGPPMSASPSAGTPTAPVTPARQHDEDALDADTAEAMDRLRAARRRGRAQEEDL